MLPLVAKTQCSLSVSCETRRLRKRETGSKQETYQLIITSNKDRQTVTGVEAVALHHNCCLLLLLLSHILACCHLRPSWVSKGYTTCQHGFGISRKYNGSPELTYLVQLCLSQREYRAGDHEIRWWNQPPAPFSGVTNHAVQRYMQCRSGLHTHAEAYQGDARSSHVYNRFSGCLTWRIGMVACSVPQVTPFSVVAGSDSGIHVECPQRVLPAPRQS